MSVLDIRQILESQVALIEPQIDIAGENVLYTPTDENPYMQVYIMFGQPENPEMSKGFREVGFMQINLIYPMQIIGTATAELHAENIRQVFYRGASFNRNDVTVNISQTPQISQGQQVNGRWFLPIKVWFYSNNF
jgi:hypothetical protein